jgi:hypothetical protein
MYGRHTLWSSRRRGRALVVFKAFVSRLGTLQDLDVALQYRIRFLSDEEKHWQRRSLGALSSFAVDLVEIET